MKILVDTCVILDAVQNRGHFSDLAKEIMLGVASEKYEGYITASSATDIYYIHRRSENLKGTPNASKEARIALEKLLDSFRLLTVDDSTIREAITSQIDDFEDAVQIESAVKGNIDYIITRNLKDFKNSPIPAYSPEDFLKLIKTEEKLPA